MKSAITCSIIVALLVISVRASIAEPGPGAPDWSSDGRFGSKCGMPQGGTDKAFCLVPFTRLIAQPERYHGKRILLFGYLWNDHDQPCLYASPDRSVEIAPGECVYIPWSAIPPDMVPAVKKGVKVRAAGKFDATFEGPVYYLGRFEEIDVLECLSWSQTYHEGGKAEQRKCTLP
jgi:hypothetical protein